MDFDIFKAGLLPLLVFELCFQATRKKAFKLAHAWNTCYLVICMICCFHGLDWQSKVQMEMRINACLCAASAACKQWFCFETNQVHQKCQAAQAAEEEVGVLNQTILDLVRSEQQAKTTRDKQRSCTGRSPGACTCHCSFGLGSYNSTFVKSARDVLSRPSTWSVM